MFSIPVHLLSQPVIEPPMFDPVYLNQPSAEEICQPLLLIEKILLFLGALGGVGGVVRRSIRGTPHRGHAHDGPPTDQ